jgi:hypothetical protein
MKITAIIFTIIINISTFLGLVQLPYVDLKSNDYEILPFILIIPLLCNTIFIIFIISIIHRKISDIFARMLINVFIIGPIVIGLIIIHTLLLNKAIDIITFEFIVKYLDEHASSYITPMNQELFGDVLNGLLARINLEELSILNVEELKKYCDNILQQSANHADDAIFYRRKIILCLKIFGLLIVLCTFLELYL